MLANLLTPQFMRVLIFGSSVSAFLFAVPLIVSSAVFSNVLQETLCTVGKTCN